MKVFGSWAEKILEIEGGGYSVHGLTRKTNENKNTNPALVDVCIFLGAEYSLGGKTSVEGSVFFNNNITNALGDSQDPQALFHQLGLRFGFLF